MRVFVAGATGYIGSGVVRARLYRHGTVYGRGGGLVCVLFEVALIVAAHATIGCRGERTATIEGPPLTIAPPSDASPSQQAASNEAGVR